MHVHMNTLLMFVSLSTVVLNSRDGQGKLWLPHFPLQTATLKQTFAENTNLNVFILL